MAFIPIDVGGTEEFKNFLPEFINMLYENSNGDSYVISNLLENYIKSKDRDIRMMNESIVTPKILIISPTMKCNLNCKGCYAKGRPKDNELSLEEIDKLINDAKELGIFLFIISGGEPFLKEGLLDVLSFHNDVLFWIFTNGTLFTETLAGSLKKCKTAFPVFSLEGFKKETDTWRGEGIYDRVMMAMELAKIKNIPFGFSATVTKENIMTVTKEDFIDTMIARGCKVGILVDYKHVDKSLPNTFSYHIAEKSAIKGVVDKYNKGNDIALIHQDTWEEMAGGCCSAGILHINSQGFVEPCPIMRVSGDNIRDKSLRDILKSEMLARIRQIRNLKEDSFHHCTLTN